MDVLQIGSGKMGGAMLARWAAGDFGRFTVVDPGEPQVPEGVTLKTSDDGLAEGSFDVLIVAIKPQMIADVMPAYAKFLKEDGLVLSIAAGTSMKSLEKALGHRPTVRVMPNLPALIGKGVNGLYANDKCGEGHKKTADALADATGTSIWVKDEDQLDRLTAVSGSGPGYVFEIARSYVAAAEGLGFDPETARALVLETMKGTAEMAISSDSPLEELRNNVTSKNGTTEAGLNALRRDQILEKLFEDTVGAAYDRAVELR